MVLLNLNAKPLIGLSAKSGKFGVIPDPPEPDELDEWEEEEEAIDERQSTNQ